MIKIDLGCGRRKPEGYIGVDSQALPGVDVVCDANERLPFEDNYADVVRAYDFLEHVDNNKRIHIMEEIYRILKPGGVLASFTPSTDGRGAFCDPTHYAYWNILSFRYFYDDQHRALYDIKCKFDVIDLYTTAKDPNEVCHVVANLRAVK